MVLVRQHLMSELRWSEQTRQGGLTSHAEILGFNSKYSGKPLGGQGLEQKNGVIWFRL